MLNLAEKYRPRTWGDIVGQDKAVVVARRLVESGGESGGSMLITGQSSGIGKTSLAEVIAGAVQPDPFWVAMMNGSSCDKSSVEQFARDCQTCAGGSGWRVLVCNEADQMTPAAALAWRDVLEKLPRRVLVIFTANESDMFGGVDGPWASRSVQIRLTNQGLAESFGARLHTIAKAENLDGQAPAFYVKAMKDRHNNFRRALMDLGSGQL